MPMIPCSAATVTGSVCEIVVSPGGTCSALAKALENDAEP